MSRPLDTLLRPSLLAVAIVLAVPLASGPLLAAEQPSSVRTYNLPAASLASTLNQIASQAGLALSLSPTLAAGKTSAPVQGQFDAAGALREALRGTGLQLQQSSTGTYSLVAVPEGVMALPETSVIGAGLSESAWGPSESYAATRTAAGHQDFAAALDRTAHRRVDLLSSLGQDNPRLAPGFGEDLLQLFGGLGGGSMAGRAVEYYRDVSLAHAGCRRRRWVTRRSPTATGVTQMTPMA